MARTADFVSPEGRVSFPNVFTPSAIQGGTPKYNITLLIPKDGEGVTEWIKKVQEAIVTKINEKFPDPAKRPAKYKMGIKNGNTCEFESGVNAGKLKMDAYPEYEDCWIISASANEKYPPTVVSADGRTPITNEKEFYAGCYGRISFNLFAYNNVNAGVSCGLQNVMKTRDGERLGGGVSNAEDDFDGLDSEATPIEGAQEAGDSMFD